MMADHRLDARLHSHSLVPSPVETNSSRSNTRKATPMPSKRATIGGRYPKPPKKAYKKALPSIQSNRQSNSNPVTPIRDTHAHSISHPALTIHYQHDDTHAPVSLQMSQTSPVDNNNKYKLRPMRKAISADHRKPKGNHFSAVSADNIHELDYSADVPSSHPHTHVSSYSQHQYNAQPPTVSYNYDNNKYTMEYNNTDPRDMPRANPIHRTQSSRLTGREHRKKHKHRHKRKHKHKKKHGDKSQQKLTLQRSESNRNNRSPPTPGTMQQMIHRAETFGVTEPSNPSKTQHRSYQAPQIPANNSIFDNTQNDHSFFGDDMDRKADPDGSVEDIYDDGPMNTNANRNTNRNTNRNGMKARVHLPLKNYGSSPVNMHPMYHNKTKHHGVSQMSNRDIQIMTLRKEIREMEARVKAKKMTLCVLEKDSLHECMERLRPITLLKRLNAFCEEANAKELELIEEILSHDVDSNRQ